MILNIQTKKAREHLLICLIKIQSTPQILSLLNNLKKFEQAFLKIDAVVIFDHFY